VAYWWLLAPLAGAQTPEVTEAPARVLVTTLQTLPATEAWPEGEVRGLERALRSAFAARHQLVSVDEVPPFRVHGYGPELYMQSCPPGRYAGCALVLGQRVGVPWAVGGTLRNVDDGQGGTSAVFEVALVDVARTVELARFAVVWDPDNRDAIVQSIVRLFDELREGADEVRDLRDGEGRADLDPAQRARLAESLAEIERTLGVPISTEVTVREPDKVTRADLEAYRRRGGPTPWTQLGMREAEYVRYRNSGQDLSTWRRAARGRQGQLLVRAAIGASPGPWHQDIEGQLLLSGFDLRPVHTVQYVEAVRGSPATGMLEVGFGILPFLDVSGTFSRRSSRATIARDQDVQGQAAIPTEPDTIAYGTTQWGGRLTLAPLFLHRIARPVAVVGLYGWRGRAVPATESFPRQDGPSFVVGEVLLGGEVDASRALGLTVRAGLDTPIAGRWRSTFEEGKGIEAPPRPSRERPLGWTVQVGFQVRADVIGGGP